MSLYYVEENRWMSVDVSIEVFGQENVYVNGVIVGTSYKYGKDWCCAQRTVFPVSIGDKVTPTRSSGSIFIPLKTL